MMMLMCRVAHAAQPSSLRMLIEISSTKTCDFQVAIRIFHVFIGFFLN